MPTIGAQPVLLGLIGRTFDGRGSRIRPVPLRLDSLRETYAAFAWFAAGFGSGSFALGVVCCASALRFVRDVRVAKR
jgi:hypothetical protein